MVLAAFFCQFGKKTHFKVGFGLRDCNFSSVYESKKPFQCKICSKTFAVKFEARSLTYSMQIYVWIWKWTQMIWFHNCMILRHIFIYSNSKSNADTLILKMIGSIHCTLNQRSIFFQNVTKSTVFTTQTIGLPKKGH